jgi:hypothetical protein
MDRQIKLTATRQAASQLFGAAFGLIRRTAASLSVWTMPLVIGALTAAAVSGSLSLHRGSGPNADSDKFVVDAEKPFSVIDLYYPGDYIKIVKRAHQERHDILADVRTLESAWNAASPAAPLTIDMIGTVCAEPITGKTPERGLRATAVICEANFQELRPILEDLRNLILEGDGTGCGRLSRSGYQAQPTSAAKNSGAGPNDDEEHPARISPAKRVPGPAETL